MWGPVRTVLASSIAVDCTLMFSPSDELVKILSLKIVELELPKWYLQFGIQQVKSSAAVSFPSSNSDSYHHNRHASMSDKDSVNVHSLMAITELFSEVMEVFM